MTIKVTYNVTDVYVTQDVSPVYINVSYSTGSSGGSAVWGGITGTLSDQTDLQTALDLKVPYLGATANVDLGEYELKAGQVEFDQTPTGTAGVGVMRWNDSDGTVDLGLKGGNVTLQVGQEQVARVVNKSGVNLLESAYQVVKVTDAQGQRLAVDLAQGNNDANSTDTIGIVTENIDNNQEGFITTSGIVRGINTTGSLQGETWNDGDVLYLSPTTAGAITNIKPTAPNHTVILGYVVYAHAVNGKIFVKCDNGYELGELHDCYLPTPSNNDGIFWNNTNLRYENKSVSSALGYTPANSATTLTINGVTYDLSTSRTWTISAGISGSGATGQVAYWDGTSSISGENNLFWDAANNRLGIGTITPTDNLDVNGTSIFRSTGTFDNSALGVNNYVSIKSADNRESGFNIASVSGVRWQFFVDSYAANNFYIFNFRTNVAALSIRGSSSNVVINSTSDTGQKLQVNGTTLLNGNVTFSSSTGMFWDATNSRLGIGTNAPNAALDVRGNIYSYGTTPFIALIPSGWGGQSVVLYSGVAINNTSVGSYGVFAVDGSSRGFAWRQGSTVNMAIYANTGNVGIGTTSDSGERLQVTGTAKITSKLSMGAGTTSAAQINLASSTAPTSPNNGDIWFDGTDIKMRIGGVTKTFTLI